ncbi:hypothetical protein M272_13875 [Vibrio natriegens NBRC 15636 = ATCC 14048 = DSM 759]|nr:membrane protein [Vibrio natriegens NBRC 15636 = ATCC 14048 = DSM 759]EPM40349.1 hypothetical protein M272_13875 [Vibrio natriegens NBRC 15636 = ATCC 14048 = DSM 759]
MWNKDWSDVAVVVAWVAAWSLLAHVMPVMGY